MWCGPHGLGMGSWAWAVSIGINPVSCSCDPCNHGYDHFLSGNAWRCTHPRKPHLSLHNLNRVGNAAMLTMQQKLQILHDIQDSVCISLRFHGAEEVWPNHCHMPCTEHISDQKRLGLLAHPRDWGLVHAPNCFRTSPHLFPWVVRRFFLLQESIPIYIPIISYRILQGSLC